MDVGRHGGNDKLSLTTTDLPLKAFFDQSFGKGKAGLGGPEAVGEKTEDALGTGLSDLLEVGRAAVNRSEVELKVGAVIDGADGSVNQQVTGVGNRVGNVDGLNDKGTKSETVVFLNHLDLLIDLKVFQDHLGKSGGQGRSIDRKGTELG